ncbi:MAG: ABC transporter permease [Myxococcales bacterium]|nr:ABC transporter permease [Myxococcales bacterium]
MSMFVINRIALKTLFIKELRRFTKVWLQTVLSPIVTTSLYFVVFGVALGSRLKTVGTTPYIEFVVPGLMMLSMINAAFLNASSSLFQSKIHGTHHDLLTAPIGGIELVLAYVGASIIRALGVGFLVWLVSVFFIGFTIHSLAWTLYFAITVSAAFACLGLLAAIYSEKFDQLAILPNFILTPLTFLGGVFYSVDMLPEPWSMVSRLNPILYTVNGLRFGLLGTSDIAVLPAAFVVLTILTALLGCCTYVLHRGVRLRY